MNEVLEQFRQNLIKSWNDTDKELIEKCSAFCKEHQGERFDIGRGYDVTTFTKFTHVLNKKDQQTCFTGLYRAMERNEKEAREFVENLEKSIKGKVGDILDIIPYMTENGKGWRVTGSLGKADVLQIYAGGYNVQRLHIRNIIRKVRKEDHESH